MYRDSPSGSRCTGVSHVCAVCFRGGRGSEEEGADAARCTGTLLSEQPVGALCS